MRAPTEILGIRYFLLGVIFTRTDTRVESSHQGTPQNKNKSFSFHFQTARAFGPGLLILLYGLPVPLGRTTTYYHILLRGFRLLVPSRPGLISYRIRVQYPLYPVYTVTRFGVDRARILAQRNEWVDCEQIVDIAHSSDANHFTVDADKWR